MTSGTPAAPDTPVRRSLAPAVVALGIYLAGTGVAIALLRS